MKQHVYFNQKKQMIQCFEKDPAIVSDTIHYVGLLGKKVIKRISAYVKTGDAWPDRILSKADIASIRSGFHSHAGHIQAGRQWPVLRSGRGKGLLTGA